SMVPIVMEPSTTNPEIVMMMASAENGTRILLTPYVTPTPNPSRLTAITKNNKLVKYSTPTKSFVFNLKLLYGIYPQMCIGGRKSDLETYYHIWKLIKYKIMNFNEL